MRNANGSTPPHKAQPRATWRRPRVSKIDVAPETHLTHNVGADGPGGFSMS